MPRPLVLSAACALVLGAALPAPAQEPEGYGYYTPEYAPVPAATTYPAEVHAVTYTYPPYYASYSAGLPYTATTAPGYLPWTVPTAVPAPTPHPPAFLDPTYGFYYNVHNQSYNYYPAARSVYFSRGQLLYR